MFVHTESRIRSVDHIVMKDVKLRRSEMNDAVYYNACLWNLHASVADQFDQSIRRLLKVSKFWRDV